jgi:branched-chain amino acid transport system substrate-binding protein
LRAGGVTAPIIGSQAFDSQKVHRDCRTGAEGTYIVDSFDRDRNDAALQRSSPSSQKRAGYPPENVAAITYSAVALMADAIKRAGSADPAKVRDALAATKNFPLLTGDLVGFNNLHEIIQPISVNVIKDGKMKSSRNSATWRRLRRRRSSNVRVRRAPCLRQTLRTERCTTSISR